MELVLLSNSKLKVMLTSADMESYALTCETLDYDNTETRRALWDILNAAKHQTGFDAASDRVLIQAYPSVGGGCEMYVTKMREKESDAKESAERFSSEAMEGLLRKIRAANEKGKKSGEHGSEKPGTQPDLFGFSSVSDLLRACAQLCATGFIQNSQVYDSPDHKMLYLILENNLADPSARQYHALLGEYGICLQKNAIPGIREHCSCLCQEGAVQHLAALA